MQNNIKNCVSHRRIWNFFGLTILIIVLFASTSIVVFAKIYQVSAWLPSWDIPQATESFEGNSDVIDTISPFWYHVHTDGTLSMTNGAEDMNIIHFAKENNIEIIPTISNSFDWRNVHDFLNDSEEKSKNIARIIDKVNFFDYDGIDIDYEGLLSADKDAFTAYIKDLSVALKKNEKKLTIAIQAKTYDKIAVFGDYGQDWEALHPYVDEFRIMTYDYGWRGSTPRPIAPAYWVENVVKYALDHVPKEKIFLGVPFYGGGWSEGYFYNYTYQTINLILERYGVDFQYDPREKTNRLFYVSNKDTRVPPVPHEVWFENSVSLEPKLDLVTKYDLGGIAIWRLGKEDKRNWKSIRIMLKEEPLAKTLYFRDVNQNTANFTEITRLAELGIVQGQDKSGWFKPYDKVNRAEILKMTLNSFARDTSGYMFEDIIAQAELEAALDLPIESDEESAATPDALSDEAEVNFPVKSSIFVDVNGDEWFYPYSKAGVDFGIIEGYPDGSFKPAQNIIRVEAIKMALESAGLVEVGSFDDVNGEWYAPYKNWAIQHGLYEGATFVPDDEITRGEAAYIIVKVIEIVEKSE